MATNFAHAGAPCLVQQLHAHHEVVVEELRGVLAVRADPPTCAARCRIGSTGSSCPFRLAEVSAQETLDCRAVTEVVFGLPRRDDLGRPPRVKGRHDRPAEEPASRPSRAHACGTTVRRGRAASSSCCGCVSLESRARRVPRARACRHPRQSGGRPPSTGRTCQVQADIVFSAVRLAQRRTGGQGGRGGDGGNGEELDTETRGRGGARREDKATAVRYVPGRIDHTPGISSMPVDELRRRPAAADGHVRYRRELPPQAAPLRHRLRRERRNLARARPRRPGIYYLPVVTAATVASFATLGLEQANVYMFGSERVALGRLWAQGGLVAAFTGLLGGLLLLAAPSALPGTFGSSPALLWTVAAIGLPVTLHSQFSAGLLTLRGDVTWQFRANVIGTVAADRCPADRVRRRVVHAGDGPDRAGGLQHAVLVAGRRADSRRRSVAAMGPNPAQADARPIARAPRRHGAPLPPPADGHVHAEQHGRPDGARNLLALGHARGNDLARHGLGRRRDPAAPDGEHAAGGSGHARSAPRG